MGADSRQSELQEVYDDVAALGFPLHELWVEK